MATADLYDDFGEELTVLAPIFLTMVVNRFLRER